MGQSGYFQVIFLPSQALLNWPIRDYSCSCAMLKVAGDASVIFGLMLDLDLLLWSVNINYCT